MAGFRRALIAVGLALGIGASPAAAGVVETGPDRLADTTSLGAIIASSADAPVHILFVHGMRAGDRGASATFRAGLCARLKDICDVTRPPKAELNHRLSIGPRPDLTWMGQPIWPTDAAWSGGGPFVDRYEYPRKGGGAPIVVDEINWWPLALPLRCLALLEPEAELAGPDAAGLRVCAAVDGQGNPLDPTIHYPFLSKADLARLIATRPKGGGAAAANGFVKRALMDWGLSDAVIALGPMRDYLHDTIDQAFAYAEGGSGGAEPAKYVVVAESLGAFIVFDAYAHGKTAVRSVLDDTSYVYFFANQVALLELGRLGRPAGPAGVPSAATPAEPSLLGALADWGAHRVLAAGAGLPATRQIIAFSDPSDALTFRVPPIPGVKVVNLYDRNGVDILHIAADPVAAHTGHAGNPQVLDVMVGR